MEEKHNPINKYDNASVVLNFLSNLNEFEKIHNFTIFDYCRNYRNELLDDDMN